MPNSALQEYILNLIDTDNLERVHWVQREDLNLESSDDLEEDFNWLNEFDDDDFSYRFFAAVVLSGSKNTFKFCRTMGWNSEADVLFENKKSFETLGTLAYKHASAERLNELLCYDFLTKRESFRWGSTKIYSKFLLLCRDKKEVNCLIEWQKAETPRQLRLNITSANLYMQALTDNSYAQESYDTYIEKTLCQLYNCSPNDIAKHLIKEEDSYNHFMSPYLVECVNKNNSISNLFTTEKLSMWIKMLKDNPENWSVFAQKMPYEYVTPQIGPLINSFTTKNTRSEHRFNVFKKWLSDTQMLNPVLFENLPKKLRSMDSITKIGPTVAQQAVLMLAVDEATGLKKSTPRKKAKI